MGRNGRFLKFFKEILPKVINGVNAEIEKEKGGAGNKRDIQTQACITSEKKQIATPGNGKDSEGRTKTAQTGDIRDTSGAEARNGANARSA